MSRYILQALGLTLIICTISSIAIIGLSYLSFQQQSSSINFGHWLLQEFLRLPLLTSLFCIFILSTVCSRLVKEKHLAQATAIKEKEGIRREPLLEVSQLDEGQMPQSSSESISVIEEAPKPNLNLRLQQLKNALFEENTLASLLLDNKAQVIKANSAAMRLFKVTALAGIEEKLYLMTSDSERTILALCEDYSGPKLFKLTLAGEYSLQLNLKKLDLEGGSLFLLQLEPSEGVKDETTTTASTVSLTPTSQVALSQQLRRTQSSLTTTCLATLSENKAYSKEQLRRQLLEQSLQLTMLSSEVIQLLSVNEATQNNFDLLSLVELQLRRFEPYAALHQNLIRFTVNSTISQQYCGNISITSQVIAQLLWLALANTSLQKMRLNLCTDEDEKAQLNLTNWPEAVSQEPLLQQLQRLKIAYKNSASELSITLELKANAPTLQQNIHKHKSIIIDCDDATLLAQLRQQCQYFELTVLDTALLKHELEQLQSDLIIITDKKSSQLDEMNLDLQSIQVLVISSQFATTEPLFYPSELISILNQNEPQGLAQQQNLLQLLLPLTDQLSPPSMALSLLLLSDQQDDIHCLQQYSNDTASSIEIHGNLRSTLLACSNKSFDVVIANGKTLLNKPSERDQLLRLRAELPTETALIVSGDHRSIPPITSDIAFIATPMDKATLSRSIDSCLNKQVLIDDKFPASQQLENNQQQLFEKGCQQIREQSNETSLASLLGEQCNTGLKQIFKRESQQLVQQIKLSLSHTQWSAAMQHANALHTCLEKFGDHHALLDAHQLLLQLSQKEANGAQSYLLQLEQQLNKSHEQCS